MSRATHWAIGALVTAIGLTLPSAATATFPGENGDLAFVSGRSCTEPCDDSSADIYRLDGPLGSVNILTSLAGQHRHPSWSPDLTTLAYARWLPNNEKIYIDDLSVAGDEQTRLGPHDSSVQDDRPAWSPNGKRIAYESEVTNGSGQLDILVVNVNNGSFINLTSTPTVTEGKPVWSPDGKFIYYHSNATGDQDIRREASDNSQATPSIVVPDGGNQFQVALSPDGTQMCYTQGSFSDSADVIVRDVSGGSPVEISDENVTVADYNCAWSPDGQKVTWVNGLTSAGAMVYKNSDDTGSIESITPNAADAFDGNADWAPKRPALCQGKPATIAGTDGADDLVGTSGKDVIAAHNGKDEVNGGGGNDTVCGGKGDDTLRGGAANDTLFGEGGDDNLIGGIGKDKCIGGNGRDEQQGCEK